MFKITGRIVLILLVASLVSGMLYLLVNGINGKPGLLGGLDRRGGFRLAANGRATPGSILAQGVSSLAFRSNFGERGFSSRSSLGRGLSGVVVDLVVVTLITCLVVVIHAAFKKALGRPSAKIT